MRNFTAIAALGALALFLASCGGGDSFSKSSGGTTSNVASVTVTSTSPSIPSDGSSTAAISALVKDANNAAMSGVTVSFASSAGGVVMVTQGTTDTSGLAKASLKASGAAAGSTLTVTATAGGQSGNATVNVVNTQQSITLVTNSPQIPSDGSKPATITALVRGANNQLLAGVTVNFQADSGAIAVTQGTTDANGSAIATLNTIGDPTNRTITVTASAGSASGKIGVAVVGTKLTLTGPASLVQGNQGTYNVALTDSGNNGIVGKTAAITSSKGNTLSSASLTTDSSGHATFQMTGTNSGTDTLAATALGMSAQQNVNVSNQNFAFTSPSANATVAIGQSQAVKVTWTSAGAAQVGQIVSFSTTRGLFAGGAATATATTDSTGTATVTISSTTSGPAIITATASGVSAQLPFTFIATAPAQISLQASPSTIPTQGQSTITAIVRDAANNLVQGQTVTFQLTDVTRGTLSVGSAITDAQGTAQSVYTASTTPSSSNGVTVTATIQGTSVPAQTVTLTVGGQAVFLSLGTGPLIGENTAKTQFSMPFIVQAVDSAGNAVNGVTVNLTVHSVAYSKGFWKNVTGNSPPWTQFNRNYATNPPTDSPGTPTCANEDVDLSGIYTVAKDFNNNGKLDPGEVAAVSPGSVVTATTTDPSTGIAIAGSAALTITYPEDHAFWVQVKLTATATVQGTQSSTSSTFWLPILASYLTGSNTPPGLISPYGMASDCRNPN